MTKKITLILATVLSLTFLSFASAQSLIPQIEYPQYPEGGSPEASKISLVKQLPADSWQVIMANTIKLILGITGSLSLIAFTVGGVMMVTAQGNEETISKGKGILFWSLLALVVIAASYGVVVGITQLEFFQ